MAEDIWNNSMDKQKRIKFKDNMVNAIRGLKCHRQVQEKIALGENFQEIVKFIHGKGELKILDENSIIKYLEVYIEENKDVFSYRRPNITKKKIKKAIQLDQTYIDPLDTYQFLEAIQMERLMIAFAKELRNDEVYKETDNQVRLLNSILKNHASVETDRTIRYVNRNGNESKIEEMPERLRTVREKISEQYGHKVSEVLSDPDSRRRLLNVLEMVKNKSQNKEAKKILQNKLDRIEAIDGYYSGAFFEKKDSKSEVVDIEPVE